MNDLIDMTDSDEMEVIELIDDFISGLTDVLRKFWRTLRVMRIIIIRH